MAGEIRNSTYPTTTVDLLLPPASANTRGGEGGDGFDSLLRALAPAERMDSRPSYTSDSAGSFSDSSRSVEARDYSQSSSSPSDQRSAAEQRRPETEHSRQAAENSERQVEDRSVGGTPPAQRTDSDRETTTEPTAQSENESGEVAEADQVLAGESDPTENGEETAEVADAAAMQLAALAAQAVAVAADQRLPVAEPAVGELQAGLPLDSEAEKPATLVEAAEQKAANSSNAAGLDAALLATGSANAQLEAVPPELTANATAAVEGIVEALAEGTSPVTEEVAAAEEEQVEISRLKSNRTRSGNEIFHEVDPKQVKTAGENQPVEPTAEPTAETGEVELVAESPTELPQVENSSGSEPKNEKDRKEPEISPLEHLEPVADATVEAAAPEMTPVDAPPAESGSKTATEQPRTDHRPQTQSQPTLVEGNARPGGAPRLAAEVLSGGPREASHARPVEIDSARFLTRVARAFTAAQQRGGEVQMRLSPPELGSLRVEVKVLDGVMTARVETENAAAKTAVLEHLPQLRERLAEQGVRIERFDVDLLQNGSSGTPDRPADRQPDEVLPRRQSGGRSTATGRTGHETTAAAAGLSTSGGLNVIV